MEFGILFTSQPHRDREPYPHRAVHERVTDEVIAADRLGFDCAWLAEHHFSTEYGIMPDVWVYAGYLAALTKRIKLGMAVVTLPLANPVRTVENAGFVDILSGGRVALGVGSGAQLLQPLAIAVIGGVAVSMILSLLITPVLFFKLREKGL